jgi:hypothetical protein
MTTTAAAASNIKERFPNANYVICKPPDSGGRSMVRGTVRYWDAFKCGGSLHNGPSKAIFTLRYFPKGGCGECWTITNLEGASINLLKRKPPAARSPWFWSEGAADSRIGHSPWMAGNPAYDPDSVDCGGFGDSIRSDDGTTRLYQHFRCRIALGGGDLQFWFRVDVTGRDTFKIIRVKGVSFN